MIGYHICKLANRLFPLPTHPFNLNNDGIMSYSKWQYNKGSDTIKFFVGYAGSAEAMFKDKVVVDIGCGAGGKTLYYASQGVKRIYGVEVLQKYETEANSLANELGLSDKFEFIATDASQTPFETGTIDTIIINDAIEHVDDPGAVITECMRILAPGGKLYMNFPPYYHPYGAHLSDAIGMPWVHVFFSDATLIKVYKNAVKNLPDGKDRIEFRISHKDGKPYFSYINKITVKQFRHIVRRLGHKPAYYREVPLRSFFAPLARLPIFKEMFVKMVVCVIEKK